MERGTVIKELEALESIAHQVQIKLSKKLSFIHRPGKNLTISTNQGFTEELQGPVTGGGGGGATASIYGSASFDWQGNEEHPMPPPSAGLGGSAIGLKKAGVSVGGSTSSEPGAGGLKSQWKSFSKSVQKSIGNDKVEDSSSYTEVVLRLMQSSYFLESMLRHYSALSPALQTHIQIIKRLRRVCDVLHHVICAFVVRDLGELMGKYVKRVGSWVSE
ncbi:hypothetical protein BGW38_008011 [Lunasporangiospora selenospora]|uniref:Uncharacterized protein n=1 Tax=Lunasporangiospora selenospora TaxID=979761 RepID=A0A9P6FKQ4_9FUNG|nr:hypothetical protein BGW38_008011 [Lunasporangiospora selenospora]